ncbi:MAG: hypothetical protein LBS04_04985 [Tannerellaceae bacterium]|jgi:hypothetical protein|nr:hypothetical protein [Tannerellaceae bacterium]
MKTYIKINALWLLLALPFAAGLQAQVSVGSLSPAGEAALLQIKEYEATAPGGATANGGLLLPRVELKGMSNITFIQSPTQEQKLNLTGLLVYNVNTSGGMEEGIYEWDGSSWGLLEIESKSARTTTITKIDTNPTSVTVGNFEFRIDPTTKNSQCRLVASPGGLVYFYYDILGLWDGNGYSYENQFVSFLASNYSTWQDLHTTGGNDRRFEIWLANPTTNRVYNVQFINVQFINTVPSLTYSVYIITATEY